MWPTKVTITLTKQVEDCEPKGSDKPEPEYCTAGHLLNISRLTHVEFTRKFFKLHDLKQVLSIKYVQQNMYILYLSIKN